MDETSTVTALAEAPAGIAAATTLVKPAARSAVAWIWYVRPVALCHVSTSWTASSRGAY